MSQQILLLGGIVLDQYVLLHEFPKRGDDVLMEDSFHHVGGCSINVAVTLKSLGMIPHIVSVIGRDERGKEIHKYLCHHELSARAIQMSEDRNTGYCLTLVEDSGERTFLTYKGCEAEFYPDMLAKDLLDQISMVFVTGYYLLDLQYDHIVIEFLKEMKNSGKQILFDPGALVSKIRPEILLSMIELSNFMTPNEGELEKILDIFQVNKNHIPEWFFQHGVCLLIEKKGNQGVKLWEKEGLTLSVPSFQVDSVDTTGAGDSFAGGIMYGILKKYSMKKALKLASACGAFATTFMGPHQKFNQNDLSRLNGL